MSLRLSLQRAATWTKLVAITGFSQIAVQAIGFLSGILVIRLLPTHEYGLYTLANTILGTMAILADGGVTTGVMAQGGKVWQDKKKLGAVMATGMYLRKRFALFGVIVGVPILIFLLRKHNASWLMSTLIVLSLIPAFIISLTGTLLEIAPKLQQDVVSLQKIQINANFVRLILLSVTLFIYPFSSVAILCAGLSQIWSNWRLRILSGLYIDRSQGLDPEIEADILTIVKKTMPGAIFYSISGQLGIWMISLNGTTEYLAQVGALSRLTMVINLVSILFGVLIVPRFARIVSNRKLLISRYLQIQFVLFVVTILILLIAWLFSIQILLILGKDYIVLGHEMILMVFGGCLGLLSGVAYNLNAVRNHIFSPYIMYAILISTQVMFLYYFQINTVLTVAYYTITMQLIAYLIYLVYGLYSIYNSEVNVRAFSYDK